MTDATARSSDPSTSHEAADRMAQSHLEQAVYTFMWPRWPRYMNSIEIAAEMGVDKWSVSPRMKPLYAKGFLDAPIKKAALNSSGNIRNLMHWRVRRLP